MITKTELAKMKKTMTDSMIGDKLQITKQSVYALRKKYRIDKKGKKY